MRTLWSFETKNLEIRLTGDRFKNYHYDGDDEDGETQAALDRGDFVAYDFAVEVILKHAKGYLGNRVVVGSDHLSGSVYERTNLSEFWTAHRDSDSMNRNCTAFRKARGENSCVAHYFPDMVRMAIRQARDVLPKNKG